MLVGLLGFVVVLLFEGLVMLLVLFVFEEVDVVGGVDGLGVEVGMVFGYCDKECFVVFGGVVGVMFGDVGCGLVGCVSESLLQFVDVRKNS